MPDVPVPRGGGLAQHARIAAFEQPALPDKRRWPRRATRLVSSSSAEPFEINSPMSPVIPFDPDDRDPEPPRPGAQCARVRLSRPPDPPPQLVVAACAGDPNALQCL